MAQPQRITRKTCPTVRRGAYGVLTESGLQALRAAWPVYAQGISRYFARWLAPGDKQVLHSAFHRMLQADAAE